MHSKPAIAPRSVREAFGPYARLELHQPVPAWRRLMCSLAGWLVMFATAVVLGVAFGWLMTLWPRMSP